MTEQLSNWPVGSKQFRRSLRESLLLEATALAQGLDTMRIGSRGFAAGAAPRYADVAFQETISLGTSRSAVRTADDRMMTKTALTQAKLRVPQSRRFGYKHIDEAVEYAQRFRRGVIIKPRMVESGRISRRALTEPEQVREVIEAWRDITGTHATYLVERRMFSREYSFIIVGDEVVSIGRCRNRRWEYEITSVHPEVLDLAVRALKAFPAMPHGEVRMFSPDPAAGEGGCIVGSVSPDIGLISVHKSKEWSIRIASHLMRYATRRLRPKSTVDGMHITAEFTMNELSEPQAMTQGIAHWMAQSGVAGSASCGERLVTGTITGTPGELATFSGLAKTGRLAAESPQTITFDQQEVGP